MIIHLFLINVYVDADLQSFSKTLREIVDFEMFNVGDFILEELPIEATEPFGLNFEALGYEATDFIGNTYNFAVMLSLMVVFLPLFGFLATWKCCPRVQRFAKARVSSTCFNNFILALDAMTLPLVICAWISICKVSLGETDRSAGFYVALGSLGVLTAYELALLIVQVCKFDSLRSPSLQDRIGAAYTGYNLKRVGRSFVALRAITFLQRMCLALIVTQTSELMLVQLCSNFYGILIVTAVFTAIWPNEEPSENRVQLCNQLILLVILCLLLE